MPTLTRRNTVYLWRTHSGRIWTEKGIFSELVSPYRFDWTTNWKQFWIRSNFFLTFNKIEKLFINRVNYNNLLLSVQKYSLSTSTTLINNARQLVVHSHAHVCHFAAERRYWVQLQKLLNKTWIEYEKHSSLRWYVQQKSSSSETSECSTLCWCEFVRVCVFGGLWSVSYRFVRIVLHTSRVGHYWLRLLRNIVYMSLPLSVWSLHSFKWYIQLNEIED